MAREPAASAALGDNAYGKSGIRLVRVLRDTERHELVDLTVDVRLTGDFEAAHTRGDNANLLPTDTMRGTVYAFAKDGVGAVEEFGQRLARHFVDSVGPCRTASVYLSQAVWERIAVDGRPHDHAFTGGSGARRTASVDCGPDGVRVVAGLADVQLLKTTGSAFAGFMQDAYTTLEPTDDRIMATSMTATWGYGEAPDWDAAAARVRQVLLAAFAEHDSQSVQHTMHEMGQAVLDACREVDWVRMVMPNRHHVLVDLSAYGQSNDGEVFVATDRPYGLIEGCVERR